MLKTSIVDDGDGYVAYIARCDEHGMLGSYSEQPIEDRSVQGPMRRISRDIHLLDDAHPKPPESWYGYHQQCRWFDNRPCWLNGGGWTGQPASPEYGLREAASILTCGCTLPEDGQPIRRYHESVDRFHIDEIVNLARRYDLDTDAIVARLNG